MHHLHWRPRIWRKWSQEIYVRRLLAMSAFELQVAFHPSRECFLDRHRQPDPETSLVSMIAAETTNLDGFSGFTRCVALHASCTETVLDFLLVLGGEFLDASIFLPRNGIEVLWHV